MKHGAGGPAMRELVMKMLIEPLPRQAALGPGSVGPEAMDDGAAIPFGDRWLVVTTDAHVVKPIFFPGGDLATTHDAERLAQAGIPADTITTGTACHLEAQMIERVLHGKQLGAAVRSSDFFFIENVGNLVCPAIYDLGQAANVVALSLTEGVDKPLKYPVMFRKADLVVLTKLDLLPYLPGVSVEAVLDALSRVMPHPRALCVSTISGEGLTEWVEWLDALRLGQASVPRARAAERPSKAAT